MSDIVKDAQQIGELLSPERFKVWIAAQEAGKVGFTADQWNCPLAYYLADGLGVGVCDVEVTEDVIEVTGSIQHTLDNFSWPHHFVIEVDALDPTAKKLPVTHEQAITCLDKAVKEAEEWGKEWTPKEWVACDSCGEMVDPKECYVTHEADTGAPLFYCLDCTGDDEDEYDDQYDDMEQTYSAYPFDAEDDWQGA